MRLSKPHRSRPRLRSAHGSPLERTYSKPLVAIGEEAETHRQTRLRGKGERCRAERRASNTPLPVVKGMAVGGAARPSRSERQPGQGERGRGGG